MPSWTSADMYLALRKLNVLGSVLYIAAHPDDENTRLITYLSKDKLFRAGYLSLTRGDGGQNLIGNEQGIELGLIRTQELLSARRIDGGEQFFSRAYDFGYSKGPEETFTKWDKEKILSDVVWVIRKFQPDVIITRFPTTGEGGHGHHTGSAILANEAFTAAADPNRFPEQLKYVQPWQAKRILWNTFNFGGISTITPDQFRIDVGGYNPLLGKSYGEIAAESRSQHKSQGFGVPASRGESFESFKTTGGSAPVKELMDGVNTSWSKIKGGDLIEKHLQSLIASFDLLHPDRSVKGLVKLYTEMSQLPESGWRNKKLSETQELIAQCSGLFIDVTSGEQYAVQTDSIRLNFVFNNRLGSPISLQHVKLDEFDSTFSQPLDRNKNLNFSKTLYIPIQKSFTQPYWLEHKMEEGYFNVKDQLLIGQPDVTPAYLARVELKIFDQPFTFVKPVRYKFTDPVKGEVYEPLVVIPPVSVRVSPEIAIAGLHANKGDYAITLTSFKNANKLQLTENRKGAPIYSGTLDRGNARTITFNVDDQTTPSTPTTDTILFNYEKDRNAFHLNSIRYDHIPYQVYFTPAKLIRKTFDLATYGKRIGYIVGAGDKVPEALEQMGFEVTLLTDKELARNNLQQFDAILTGVRAYNTNDWMNTYYDKLMNYVNEGGNLIVQYNTSNNIGNQRAKMGPYPFDISRTRITDENAAVTLLKPEHPVLNFPNKIGPDDFKGWIQERSIYHAAKRDSHFEAILSMNDPGEKADDGSLVIAQYGKGWFTYTGLVFFRELPAGVPGAYRLLANLIALNKKKAF